MKIELASLLLCAEWHRDQAKLYIRLGHDAHAESNKKHCADMAFLHERWASAIAEAHTTMKGK